MSKNKTTKIEESSCPSCGYVMDLASDPSGKATPKVGDFSICNNCGEILRFDICMLLYKPDKADVPAEVRKAASSVVTQFRTQRRWK